MDKFKVMDSEIDKLKELLKEDVTLDDIPDLYLHMLDNNVKERWHLYRSRTLTTDEKQKLSKDQHQKATSNVRICFICDEPICGASSAKAECFRNWTNHCINSNKEEYKTKLYNMGIQ